MTNRDLLVRVLTSDEFVAGGTDTAFLDRHPEVFEPLLSTVDDRALAALAAAAWPGVNADGGAAGRLAQRALRAAAGRVRRAVGPGRASATGSTGPARWPAGRSTAWTALVARPPPRRGACCVVDGRAPLVPGPHGRRYVLCGLSTGVGHAASRCRGSRCRRSTAPAGSLLAPMPGAVGRVLVAVGDRVAGRRRAADPGGDEARTRRSGRRPTAWSTELLVAPGRPGRHRRPARGGDARRDRRREDGRVNFDDTPEQSQLRDAVAAMAARYGHSYFVSKAKIGRAHRRAVGRGRQARLPRGQRADRVRRRGRRHHRPGHRLRGAGRGRLPAAAARGVAGDRRRPSWPSTATEDQQQRFLPGIADGSDEDRVRHHRTGGGLELPPAHHDRPPRRRRVGPQRPQVLHLRRRRGRRTCWSSPGPTRRGTGKLSPALFVVPTDAPGLTTVQARDGDRVAGEPVAALLRRRTGAARRADRRRHRRPACRRCSPGSTRSGSRWRRWASAPPGTRWRGHRPMWPVARCGAARSARTRASPTRWPTPRSRSSWPG